EAFGRRPVLSWQPRRRTAWRAGAFMACPLLPPPWEIRMIRNSADDWGWPAKLLHWIGAALILLLLAHGWWMTHLAPRGPDRIAHYAGHAAMGYDFLAILVLRLLWRWTNQVPPLPAGLKAWERAAAHLAHFGLYLLMLATTVSG